MYRKILVTLDRSPLSEAVLPEALRLVEGSQARVVLLSVAEPPEVLASAGMRTEHPLAAIGALAAAGVVAVAPPRRGESRDQAFARVRHEMREYLDAKARPLLEAGVEVETAVGFGDPAETIINYARSKDIDLIAMATHGRSGLARLVFGSVASRVLESGVKPVMLVRPNGLKKTD